MSGWDDQIEQPAAPEDGAIRLAAHPDARELLAALRGSGEASPTIDAGDVAGLSMPALQVLLAAMRAAGEAGGRLRVLNPSFAFSLAFEALGFTEADEPFTVEYT